MVCVDISTYTDFYTENDKSADNSARDDDLSNQAMKFIDTGKFEELNTVMGEQINLLVDAFIDTDNTKSMELSY